MHGRVWLQSPHPVSVSLVIFDLAVSGGWTGWMSNVHDAWSAYVDHYSSHIPSRAVLTEV